MIPNRRQSFWTGYSFAFDSSCYWTQWYCIRCRFSFPCSCEAYTQRIWGFGWLNSKNLYASQVDSIPAVFGVTRDPFVVFTSNLFAILGNILLHTLLGFVAFWIADQSLAWKRVTSKLEIIRLPYILQLNVSVRSNLIKQIYQDIKPSTIGACSPWFWCGWCFEMLLDDDEKQ